MLADLDDLVDVVSGAVGDLADDDVVGQHLDNAILARALPPAAQAARLHIKLFVYVQINI